MSAAGDVAKEISRAMLQASSSDTPGALRQVSRSTGFTSRATGGWNGLYVRRLSDRATG